MRGSEYYEYIFKTAFCQEKMATYIRGLESARWFENRDHLRLAGSGEACRDPAERFHYVFNFNVALLISSDRS